DLSAGKSQNASDTVKLGKDGKMVEVNDEERGGRLAVYLNAARTCATAAKTGRTKSCGTSPRKRWAPSPSRWPGPASSPTTPRPRRNRRRYTFRDRRRKGGPRPGSSRSSSR